MRTVDQTVQRPSICARQRASAILGVTASTGFPARHRVDSVGWVEQVGQVDEATLPVSLITPSTETVVQVIDLKVCRDYA